MKFKSGNGQSRPTIYLSSEEVDAVTGKTSEEISDAINGMIFGMPQLGEITLRQAERIRFEPPSVRVDGARSLVSLLCFGGPVLKDAVVLTRLAKKHGVEIHNPRIQGVFK